jgi:hypothetical protein
VGDTDANKRDDLVVSAPERSTAAVRADVAVFGTVRDCQSQPDAWHEYNFDSTGVRTVPGQSTTISPGYFSRSEAAPRVPRDPNRWTKQVRDSVATRLPWQLVISFNEWGEGTAVESATAWSSRSGYGQYVDVLHIYP